jgi:ribosomal-protein-alanine N-acetyltransferase
MDLEIALSNLLLKLDSEFDPPLSSSIDISAYTQKIVEKATIIDFLENGELIGFIAFYCNDNINKIGYLSMLAVAKEKRGNGLAISMINSAIENLKRKGFQKFRLEVYKTNLKAVRLYEQYGFTIIQQTNHSYIMNLNLNI